MIASSGGDDAPRHSRQARASERASQRDTESPGALDDQTIVSKSQRKRDAQALQELGTQLAALSPARLARLALPAALREAVLALRTMPQHGARLRQLQYIGRLMRQLEPDELRLVQQALDPARAGLPPPTL